MLRTRAASKIRWFSRYAVHMKPLFHPSLDDITVEGILHALSEPVRAHILAKILHTNGAKTCSAFLEISDRPIPKSTLSQHFKVLREAGLIRSERKGVELHNAARCEEISSRFGPLVSTVLAAHLAQEQRRSAAPRARRAKRA
jgi:DNA-binding transcriptional ArsR family regulator